MPASNATNALKDAWMKELNKFENIKFEIKTIEEFMPLTP
jgi:hypothetical protein